MSTSRIKWDEEEKNRLAEFVARVRISDISSSLTEILNDAQIHVLPEGRRRPKLSSYRMVDGFDKLVKIHVDRLVSPVVYQEKDEKKPEEVLTSLTVGALIDMIIDKFSAKLQNTHGHTSMERITERYNISTGIHEQETKKITGPTIGVVGLYLANFRALENRLKSENVRLKYFDGEKNPYTVPSIEYVVCVPNKLPHKWQSFVREQYGENAYIVKGRLRETEKVIKDIVRTGKSTLHY